MPLFELVFKVIHVCPFGNFSQRFPSLKMYFWCNGDHDVIEIVSVGKDSEAAVMEELAQLQGIIEQTYERRRIHRIIEFLQKNGFEAKSSVGIPLKPIAVQCGLGWQGKNTSLN